MELPIGSKVLVPNGIKGLIVQFTSGTKAGVIDSLLIACSTRSCGHSNLCGGHSCDSCDASVRGIFNVSDNEQLVKYVKDGCNFEPFWSLYRDVEIVAYADYNGIPWTSFAGPSTSGATDPHGKRMTYWI